MKRPFTILIADPHLHIREFLKREFAADGFLVQVAKSGGEVLRLVFSHEHLDLLVLDPDLPDAAEVDVLEELQKRVPTLPVVVHTFFDEYLKREFRLSAHVFVEKSSTNIDILKEVISEMLRKTYLDRFEPEIYTREALVNL